jgi:hypothetical protein
VRENVVITPEMIRAQSGEAAQLLTRLNKLDRNSKQARKIRRQLRKLVVSLSGTQTKSGFLGRKREGRRFLRIRPDLYPKKKKEFNENKAFEYAVMLAQHGYDTPSKIAEILVMRFGGLPRASATELGRQALSSYKKQKHIGHAGMIENPRGSLLSVKRELQQAKYRLKGMLPAHPQYRELKRKIKELRELYHRLGGTRRYNPVHLAKLGVIGLKAVSHLMKRNPSAGAKEIYGRILAIEAQKGPKSNYPNENFRHDFKPGAKIYGLPDGSILIKGKKKLWKEFEA